MSNHGHAAVRLAAALLIASRTGFGQQAVVVISGAITVQQQGIVRGASVEVLNTATTARWQAVSNESGFYTAPALPVGEYTVSATAPGFKRAVRTGIVLQVNQTAQVNIVLDVGQVAETVEVVAEAQLVDTGSSTLGVVIEN